MARRTKEEAQETRKTIMMEALGLFCQQGVATTSLSDIARAAGVTRGAIYWHFKDKEELFLALWHEMCAPLSHLLNASIDVDERDPLGKFRVFLVELLRTLSSCTAHQQMFRIMFKMMQPDSELSAIRELIREEVKQHMQHTRCSLANAVRRGQLPSTLPVERAAFWLHASMDGLIINWLNRQEPFDLAAEAEALVQALLFSLQHNLGQP